ncbi:MAG: HEAT repeat domain-containing protein [Opitutaceae bacterium]|nr:HEAT repeat domain-containing protein [Opitutaceae bacterium]
MDRDPNPVVAAASDEPLLAIKRFKIPAEFSVSLYAAEPLLANPVAFGFDEKNVAYVAETYRYRSSVLDIRDYMKMLEQDLAARSVEDRTQLILDQFGTDGKAELSRESEVLRRVVDTDGDGVADTSSVFASGFNDHLDGIASGVLARDGEVWFTNMPHLWKLKGPDAAGKSMGRTSISYGYGVRFGFTGHDSHGLIMGPDGKLYFSFGDRGARVRTKEGTIIDSADCGAVFRCNPDGTELELVHTGLRNPQELAFDDFGNLFTGDNDCDQGDVERFVYVVEGGDSGWRVGYQHSPLGKAGPWNLERLWVPHFEGQAAYIVPPIVNTADGPSGLTHYPGTGLPDTFRDAFFMCHFKGSFTNSGIFLYQLAPDGAFFRMVRQESFVSGTLPTDVEFGTDGRLYFSDWGQGWAKSKRGRLYALTHKDMVGNALVAETKRLIAEGMAERSDADTAALLNHADQRVRREAQYALAARGARGRALLESAAQRSGPLLPRLHAIWGLGQQGRKDPAALASVPALLTDGEAEVRAQAAKVLGDARIASASARLIPMLRDPSARVAYFAAQSLGKLAAPEAAPALIDALRANADRDLYLRHALVMGLVGCANPAVLSTAAADTSRSVRLGVLLAYRRLGNADIARFLADADPLLVIEAARAINDAPIVAAQPALAALLTPAAASAPPLLVLRVLNAQFRLGTAANARALATFAADRTASESLRVEALTQLAAWPSPPARDRIVGVYRPLPAREPAAAHVALASTYEPLLADPSEAVVLSTLRTLTALGLTVSGDAVFALIQNESASTAVRVAALKPLAAWKHPRLAEAVRQAGLSKDAELRAAAQDYFSHLGPKESQPLLVHALTHGKVIEQQSALSNLATIEGAEVDTIFVEGLKALKSDAAKAALQVEYLDGAEKRSSPQIKALLEARTAALASAKTTEKFSFALQGGNRQRGRKLFNDHPVLACVRCHKVNGEGGEAGPALDTVGATNTREYVLESIVTPNAAIAKGFDAVFLTLKDGSSQVGSIASENDTTLLLRPASGDIPIEIQRSAIVKRESAPSSMPEIYGLILTRSELRDLVEYVASLGTARKGERTPREAEESH